MQCLLHLSLHLIMPHQIHHRHLHQQICVLQLQQFELQVQVLTGKGLLVLQIRLLSLGNLEKYTLDVDLL